jgi:hypothetical protein
VYEGADDFVNLQYMNNMTHKAAWFAAMDSYYYPEEGWEEGLCVVYAKGGSTYNAQYNREHDSFIRYGDDPVPATSNQPDGWYSSWSSQDCNTQ